MFFLLTCEVFPCFLFPNGIERLLLCRETASETYLIETKVTSRCSLMYFYLFFVLVTQLSYSLASTHSQNLFAISNVFTCFLISKILGLQTLHIAFKQHCSMKCISLSLINYSNPKAMLIYTCCQWCLRTLALNANCRGTKLQWQPVLLGYAFYTDSQILHWIRALEDPSEATAMWSVWSNINTYCLQKLLLSYLCLSLVPPLGWHKAA